MQKQLPEEKLENYHKALQSHAESHLSGGQTR